MQKHAGILVEVCRRAFCWHFITYLEPGCKTPFSPIRSNFRGKLGSVSPPFITHKYTQLKLVSFLIVGEQSTGAFLSVRVIYNSKRRR